MQRNATVYQLGVEQGSLDVLKPYRIHEAENRASSFSRRPIVLARLPFVGQNGGRLLDHPPEQHHLHEQSTIPSAPIPTASISATHTPEQIHERPGYEESAPLRQRIEAANSVAPHFQSQSFIADDQVASETSFSRMDSGHQSSTSELRTNQQQSDQPQAWSRTAESSSGLFQLQKQFATNSGLIVTLALIASALFLYMAIIAPVEPPTMDYSNSYEFYGVNQAAPMIDHSTDAQVNSLGLPIDPFEVEAKDSGQDSLAVGDDSPIGGAFDHRPSEIVTADPGKELLLEPTQSKANRRPEVVQLPMIDEDSVDAELIFDDASAFVYPSTPQPIFDFGPLNISGESTDSSNNESAVANRPQFN